MASDNTTSSIGYGIYFEAHTRVRLPVNPTEQEVVFDGDNTNYNVAGVGEIVVPRLPKLATIEIESYFPRNSYTTETVADSWKRPEYYVNFFRKLQKEKTVFRVIINRRDNGEEMFDTNILAVVNSFKIKDKGGEAGDIYYTLSLQEYRDATPKKVEVVKEDTTTDTTELTEIKQRATSNDEICVGDEITVTGPVFIQEEPSNVTTGKNKAKGYLRETKCVVGRVLPPQAQAKAHGVYAEGVGWVDKNNCIKGNVTQSKYARELTSTLTTD